MRCSRCLTPCSVGESLVYKMCADCYDTFCSQDLEDQFHQALKGPRDEF